MRFERKLAIIGSIASILGIFLWFYDYKNQEQIIVSNNVEKSESPALMKEIGSIEDYKKNETEKEKANDYTSSESKTSISKLETKEKIEVKSLIFENAGLKDVIRVEMNVIKGRVSGNLIINWDYEEDSKEVYPFKSRTLYKSPSGEMRIDLDGLDAPYNLPSWQSNDYIIWNIRENSAGEDYLIIPTHGKNYETLEFMDYDMILEQAEN